MPIYCVVTAASTLNILHKYASLEALLRLASVRFLSVNIKFNILFTQPAFPPNPDLENQIGI